jgi:hypothetical protein
MHNRKGKTVTKAILVKDMKNLSMIPNRQGIQIFGAMSNIERTYYPRNLVKIYMINSSWLVTSGW